MIDIYLAVPYSDKSKKVREERFYKVTKMAGQIMKAGYTVISPVTHCHPAAILTKLPTGYYEFWRKHCLAYLNVCKVLCCYELTGWGSSIGFADEFRQARSVNKPIMLFKSFFEFKNQIDAKLEMDYEF